MQPLPITTYEDLLDFLRSVPENAHSSISKETLWNGAFKSASFWLPEAEIVVAYSGPEHHPPVILGPRQFKVARALAQAFGHFWKDVPEGTYDVAQIRAWCDSLNDSWPGIMAPTVDDMGYIIHATGTGRLEWRIAPTGETRLSVCRPDAEGNSYAVAELTVLSDQEEVIFHTSLVGRVKNWRTFSEEGKVRVGWMYDVSIKDDRLCQRHVEALVEPLAALLLLREEEWDERRETAEAWDERVRRPTVARAKAILAPLYEIALPDPWQNTNAVLGRNDPPVELPATRWEMQYPNCYPNTAGVAQRMVWHQGESFPVESERTAVYALALLAAQPDLSLIDAVRQSIQAATWRTDGWYVTYKDE